MNIHLCVITGQALANLIPLLQEKPDHIVLLYSNDMTSNAQSFCLTLKEAGFKPDQIHSIPGLPTRPYESISLYALEKRDELRQQFPDSHLTWNATGGTKLMALAIKAALDPQDRIIYTDTQHGLLEELSPDPSEQPLASVLTPTLYLHALGKLKRHAQSDKVEWRERAETRQTATFYLAENVEKLVSLLQQFNRLIDNNQGRQEIHLSNIGSRWQQALDNLQTNGLLEWDSNEDTPLTIVSNDSARYLTGGWLEEYVWQTAQQQKLEHVEAGLKFGDREHRRDGEDNEIDTLILHHNRLLVVECKSGILGSDNQKDSNIIYKLDSVADQAGGLLVTKLLVSAQPLQHDTKKGRRVNTEARARATNIHTLASNQLVQLGRHLQQWAEKGYWQE